MKRIITFLLLIASLQSSAQTWPSNYTRLNSNYYWQGGAFDALNLPTRDTSLLTGQWVRAGSIIFDSTQAAGSRVWVYNGAYWERLGTGGEGFVSIGAENGLTAVNDSTLRLGGAVDSGAVLQVVNVERMNNRNSRIFITNDTTGLDDDYDDAFTQNGLSGSLLRITKKSTEARGDTLNLQYGGAMSILYDRFYDSTSSRFVAGGTDIGLNNLGYYSQARFYPPRDSVNVYTSTFGVTGSLFAGALGFGDSYGYNFYVAPSNPTSNPDLPISVSKMEIDFVREIDQTRRKKMTGTGVTSYFSDWKLLQSTINGGTPTTGNYISKVRGFHAYGGVYTQVGGALTKEQIFAVAKVDTSVGLWVSPQRRALNEVNSGYGFVIEGEDDYNHIAGYLKVAGTMPTRDNGGQTETVDVTGSILGSTAVMGGKRISNNAYLQGSQVDRTKPIYAFGDFLSDAIPGVTHLNDTIGTGYSKKNRLMQNDMRYHMNDDYVSFNNAALETNLLMFFVQDSIEVNNSGASASTVTGQRNQITFDKHSTQSNPSKVKQSGTTASKAVAVTTSTLTLGSTNMYLDGWYAGYNSIASSANAGDTIARFVSFNSIPDNTTSGRISKHFALMADAVSNADSAFGVYQVSAGAYNLFGGQTKFGNLTTPTATVDIAGTLRYVDGNQQAGYVLTSDASGNATWQAAGSGGSVNLANSDLTQTAAIRVFNLDAQALYWDSIGSMRWYNDAGTSRIAELEGSNRSGYWGDPSGESFGFTVDSLFLNNIQRVTDTTGHQVVARTPTGGLVWISAGALAGSGGGITSINSQTGPAITFATGTTGTDFNISASGNTITLNIPDASSTARGLVTNTTQGFLGTKTFSGQTITAGLFNSTNYNLGAGNAGTAISTNVSSMLVESAANTHYRVNMSGTTATTLTANYNYGNLIVANTSVTEATGGNHQLIASAIFRATTITGAGASVSNTATLYVEGPSSATVTGANYSIWAKDGYIATAGTEAGTFRWNEAASESPTTTTYAAPTNYVGANTNSVLFTPHEWLRVSINGTLYLIPAYEYVAP